MHAKERTAANEALGSNLCCLACIGINFDCSDEISDIMLDGPRKSWPCLPALAPPGVSNSVVELVGGRVLTLES